jgi:ribonuclease P protein component
MALGQEWQRLVEKKSLLEEDKKEERNSLHKRIPSLKKRSDFLFVRKSGESIRSKHFIVNYLIPLEPKVEMGITVSKKIGNAVKRNYIKRVIRSIIRNNSSKIPNNLIFEIIPKKKIETISFFDLEKDLLDFIKKV